MSTASIKVSLKNYIATMILGCHVSRYHAAAKASIVAHIEVARQEALACQVDLRAFQIFVGGPNSRKINLKATESAELRQYLAKSDLKVYAHSVYVAPPFNGDPDAARFVREELEVCAAAGISGLVVHLPKAPIEVVMKYITRLLNPSAVGVRIFLETPAVTPRETYYETPEKLQKLFESLRELDPDHKLFGLCVDTAHLWTNGIDLSSRQDAKEWLRQLSALHLPSEALMFHVNDSERACGTGPDSHAGLLTGHIWKDYRHHPEASGLAAFIQYATRHHNVVILERKPKEALEADYHLLAKLGPSIVASDSSKEPSLPQKSGGSLDLLLLAEITHKIFEIISEIVESVGGSKLDQNGSIFTDRADLKKACADYIYDKVRANTNDTVISDNTVRLATNQAMQIITDPRETDLNKLQHLQELFGKIQICTPGPTMKVGLKRLIDQYESNSTILVRARHVGLPVQGTPVSLVIMVMVDDLESTMEKIQKIVSKGAHLILHEYNIPENAPEPELHAAYYDIIHALGCIPAISGEDLVPATEIIQRSLKNNQYRSISEWHAIMAKYGFTLEESIVEGETITISYIYTA